MRLDQRVCRRWQQQSKLDNANNYNTWTSVVSSPMQLPVVELMGDSLVGFMRGLWWLREVDCTVQVAVVRICVCAGGSVW